MVQKTGSQKNENLLSKRLSFRLTESDFQLIEEAKRKMDVNIPYSLFLRFLIKESIHFSWYNQKNSINNLNLTK